MDAGFGIADLTIWLSDRYKGRNFSLEPFVYPLDFTLGSQATVINTLPILANCDFLFLNLAISGSIPNATIMIVDSGTNEQYMQNPVQLASYAQFVYRPNLQPYPRIVAGKSVLTVTLTNLYTDPVTPSLSFEGFNIYTY